MVEVTLVDMVAHDGRSREITGEIFEDVLCNR